jgi:hypothetical protein
MLSAVTEAVLSGAENFLESKASLNLRKRSPARIQFESLTALVF